MKIAVWHNLPSGGGARALNNHIIGLLDKGHTIEIWGCNPTANYFMKFPDSVNIHIIPLLRYSEYSFRDNVQSFFFQKDNNIKAMEDHCMACADNINEGDFDVLLIGNCKYYAAPFMSRYVKIPTVLYHGEPFRYFYEAQPYTPWYPPGISEIQWLRRSYWQLFFKDLWYERRMRVQLREERLNIETTDKLLVNSVFSSESCARAYNRAGEVCYLGINTDVFKPAKKAPSSPYVIGLGNLFFNKNPLLAVDTIGEIPEHKRPTLLWVSNMKDGALYEEIIQLAELKNVRFEVKEMVSDEELVLLLSNAICMLYTSRLEPFGLAPLEANACQTPVVAVAQGGVRETIIDGKNGFLCVPEATTLAERIELLIDNPERQAEMGRVALQNVQKNWTLEAATDRIEVALLTTKKNI
jgi:glycosyltransferase involved in cell wall biosynthesis